MSYAPSEQEPAVVVEAVSKSYDRAGPPAVDGVSLTIPRGEIFGILGDNGAGKSTLAKLVTGLLRPDAGTVRTMGMDVADDHLSGTAIAYMPQDSRAMNRLTVAEAIHYSAKLRGLSRTDARAEVTAQLGRWGLEELRNKVSSTLSGGQRRLLQLAVTFAGSLPLVVLDEPTNDLDPMRRRRVWENLTKLREEQGLTVLFVTHDAVEAEKVVDRVAIMQHGRFTAIGAPAELKAAVALTVNVYVRFREGALPPELADRATNGTEVRQSLHQDDALAFVRSVDLERVEEISVTPATLEELYIHYAS